MRLPFSLEQFLDLLRRYNDAIGRAPFVLTACALAAVGLMFRRVAWRDRVISGFLAFLWLWAGAVYHWAFFSRLTSAAWLFGALFVAQGLLVAGAGLWGGTIAYRVRGGAAAILGALAVAYALAVYPLLGFPLGHGYPAGPSFGAPCPTVIFFLGMMMWADTRHRVALLIVPMLWAVVGTSAALQLGIREDLGLPVAAVLAVAVMLGTRWHARPLSPAAGRS